ncbi:MAG: glycosyltransferase N-terminal domain-containing protein, partial [Parvibaculum sp.]
MTSLPTSSGLVLYRLMTRALAPVAPILLRRRIARGKEDPARLDERFGYASRQRPTGRLVWFHAASIGESLSILPLVERLLGVASDISVLVTTGTVTSAKLMAERLPPRAVHQFVPLDHPGYCSRFLDHWRPDLAIWVESEFW